MNLFKDLIHVAEETQRTKNHTGLVETAAKAVDLLRNSSYLDKTVELLNKVYNIQDEFVTYLHSLEVALLSVHFQPDFEQHLNVTFDTEILLIGGLLHDIGKTMTDIKILTKPSALTPEERKKMKKHTVDGKNILLAHGITNQDILDIAEFHHEDDEGKGYWGIRLEDLNRYVTVVSVADQFSAISQERSYKAAKNVDDTLKLMQQNNVNDDYLDLVRNSLKSS